ncbi:hypothetical protein [Streptomyces sp. SID13031]|uniref:hypothetical protein n=1 Tax=Streptomyces sp. SID13031 TaxID=2706046 RepID=UPI0013C8414B|nr:hypothetical protein [Streptomyces sp. SID13031]NEA32309.1 hypothetical protein [Streptomyces sp. SID13031]
MDDLTIRTGQAELIRARAVGRWPAVLASLKAAEALRPTGPDEVRQHTFGALDEYDRELTVRLDAVPLPGGRLVRVFANTTSDNHVIQLSDQLTPEQEGPALAGGVAELVAVRWRADTGAPAVRGDLLDSAVVSLEVDPARMLLSERDYSRLGQLDWLAAQAADPALDQRAQQAARDALLVQLDEMGLQPTSDDDRQQRLRKNRLLAVQPRLSTAGQRALRELTTPLEELPARDAQALVEHRARLREPALVREPAAVREPAVVPAASGSLDGRDLATAAAEAAAERDRRSAQTVGSLREFATGLPPGDLPKVRLMIGGGAALAGRDPDLLVVDGRGRWHVDPIPGIVQSADQVRHLAESGMGDPYDVTGPRERVPLSAIQLWEDRAAVRGPVIDGTARLGIDDAGRLIADIRPLDGSEPIRVAVDGTPLVATGVPPEIVPGASRWFPTIPESLAAVDEYLADARTPEAGAARGLLRELRDEPGTAGAALTMLNGVPEVTQARAALRAGGIVGAPLDAAMTTLEATDAWDRARRELPGRVLIGDEIGDGEYDPAAGQHWLIAGIGGGAIANAEIILAGNPQATVTMVGTEAPWVLHNDAQYSELRRLHDRDVNPEASGRLRTIPDKRLGMVGTARTEDGRTVVRMLDDKGRALPDATGKPLEGDVYVGCLGRVARTPRAMDELRAWADEVHGELQLSDDQQYLGYRVSCRKGDAQVEVDVTGAASRMLPADLFDARSAALVAELGLVEAPPESGNVAAGFMATALQASNRARQNVPRAGRPHARGME